MNSSEPAEKTPQEWWIRLRFAPAQILAANISATVIGVLVLLGSWLGWVGRSITTASFTASMLVFPALAYAAVRQMTETGWHGSKFDVLMLLAFQVAISFFAASLRGGHFQTAIIILVVFAAILELIAGFMKNL